MHMPAWVRGNPAPSSGMGQRVAGFVLIGLGALNLALLPVCFADFYPENSQNLCKVTSITVGAAALTIGIPLLIWGYVLKGRQSEWKHNRGLAYHVNKLTFAAQSGGAVLSYRSSW
ncbi:MAG: hypothetical protein RL701_2281 [Pseudomonadota bacterium]